MLLVHLSKEKWLVVLTLSSNRQFLSPLPFFLSTIVNCLLFKFPLIKKCTFTPERSGKVVFERTKQITFERKSAEDYD